VIRRLGRAALVLLLGLAAVHAGRAAWIDTKAHLAQHLVRRAWQRARAGDENARPWPWADTKPVARLLAPAQGVELFVLAGAGGRTMAFGPGHLDGTALPGEPGNAVLSGHRDTHFAFLRRLRAGDVLLVERPDGRVRRYTVNGTRVVDQGATWVAADAFFDTRLTLVTCYPFDAIRPGGRQRYVVTARADDAVSDTLTAPPLERRPAGRTRGHVSTGTGDHHDEPLRRRPCRSGARRPLGACRLSPGRPTGAP
jgi:sortase A